MHQRLIRHQLDQGQMTDPLTEKLILLGLVVAIAATGAIMVIGLSEYVSAITGTVGQNTTLEVATAFNTTWIRSLPSILILLVFHMTGQRFLVFFFYPTPLTNRGLRTGYMLLLNRFL